MQKTLAISWLTWKAAIRFRLFLVLTALLFAAVVGLPILIKDDGTAEGFTQILLTYTLSTITALLGFSTLWLACGLLARDIEECQMQVVAVKPISRWQIWLGKWIGLVSLNAVLLAMAGAGVYGLLQWRASRLPPQEQEVLRSQVLVARGSARESSHEQEIDRETDARLADRLKITHITGVDLTEVRQQIRERVVAELQVVPSGSVHAWVIRLDSARNRFRDQPLYLRVKFNAAAKSDSGTFAALWQVGDPDKTEVWHSEPMSLAPDTFHEFEIPANLADADGKLTIMFKNVNDTALLFPFTDGMEVLYHEGSYGLNYIRGLGIILCWLALLATLGLTMASSLSFPVAAFCSLTLMAMTLFSGAIAGVAKDASLLGFNQETGEMYRTVFDPIFIPILKAIVGVINLAKDFSPIDSLGSGRSITWTELSLAFVRIVLLLGGIIGGIGMIFFHRRELATAQGTQ